MPKRSRAAGTAEFRTALYVRDSLEKTTNVAGAASRIHHVAHRAVSGHTKNSVSNGQSRNGP